MSNIQKTHKQKIFSISSNVGVEQFSTGPTRTTGFSATTFDKGQEYEDKNTRMNYILIIFSGRVKIFCDLYNNKKVEKATMIFFPKNTFFRMVAEKESEVMLFGFSTTIVRTDKDLLNYFCVNARKFKDEVNTLYISEEMQKVLDLIYFQLLSQKMKKADICETWNSLFFHTIQSFYTRSEIISFLHPLFSTEANFETFIESNYIESAGNVTALIQLSGIPYARFHALFFEKYGMTAKAWLDEKARNRIILMASEDNTTVTDMAKMFNMSTQRFCAFCRRLFECTPRDLLARYRDKKQSD